MQEDVQRTGTTIRIDHRPPPGLNIAATALSTTVKQAGLNREVLFVPPSMPATDLLVRMQASRTHLAIVIDEFGGTDGLVTLEDLVEELIGEITERVFMHTGQTGAQIHALRALGMRIAIDDFGTGYSSLAYLTRLELDYLKIDKTFVQDAPRHGDDAALVETILSVARHMRLTVVAEGVETPEQAAFLAERAGDVIYQGFLFGKPEPAADWLARRATGALRFPAALAP